MQTRQPCGAIADPRSVLSNGPGIHRMSTRPAQIEVFVRRAEHLFDELDPSPLRQKDLNPKVEADIETRTVMCSRSAIGIWMRRAYVSSNGDRERVTTPAAPEAKHIGDGLGK
jgi:hypothetical protein